MKRNKIDEMSKNVLKNYLINSPSLLPFENRSFFEGHKTKRSILFQDRLKLPLKLFRDASVLDLGCGTGEQDIMYGMWGSNCTLVDMNPISTKKASSYFKSLGLQDNLDSVETKSLFDFSSNKKFDFVFSEGVLHHTADPKKGFNIMVDHLADNGFIMLQLAFDSSHFQRSLQRFILDYLTDGDINEIIKISKRLFKETLERANKYGGRSIDQIVFDFYTNPKHKGVAVSDCLSWFEDKGIQYYSSYPQIEPEGLIDGLHLPPSNVVMQKNSFLTSLADFFFMTASINDQDLIQKSQEDAIFSVEKKNQMLGAANLKDYEYGSVIDLENFQDAFVEYCDSIEKLKNNQSDSQLNTLKIFKKEVCALLIALKKRDLDQIEKIIHNFDVLFRGYNGVPSNYIVGYKKT